MSITCSNLFSRDRCVSTRLAISSPTICIGRKKTHLLQTYATNSVKWSPSLTTSIYTHVCHTVKYKSISSPTIYIGREKNTNCKHVSQKQPSTNHLCRKTYTSKLKFSPNLQRPRNICTANTSGFEVCAGNIRMIDICKNKISGFQ